MSNLHQIQPRWIHAAASIAVLVVTATAHATIINPSPISDHINAIIAVGTHADAVYEDGADGNFFTTFVNSPNIQRSLVELSNTSLDAALVAAGGPAPGGWVIHSATLTIGDASNPYHPAGAVTANRITTFYDPATVTWNNFGTGGGVGAYTTSGDATISYLNANQSTFDLTAIVQDWIAHPADNLGVFFLSPLNPDTSNSYLINSNASVTWSFDFDVVPEPSTLLLGGAGGLLLWQRRKFIQ